MSDITEAKQTILDRLHKGDTLLATRASGVSWNGGSDAPDKGALHACLDDDLIGPCRPIIILDGHRIELFGLRLTKKGRELMLPKDSLA